LLGVPSRSESTTEQFHTSGGYQQNIFLWRLYNRGGVSETALGELKLALRNTARQCADIIERDRGPRDGRHGAAFVLALRPWKYSGFRQFER